MGFREVSLLWADLIIVSIDDTFNCFTLIGWKFQSRKIFYNNSTIPITAVEVSIRAQE